MRTNGIITEFISAKTKEGSTQQTVLQDQRAARTPTNKKDFTKIRAHINSYNPQISHYTRQNAPFRRYLDSSLTIKAMSDDFNSNGRVCSYQLYAQVFREENIGFSRPRQDDCDLCQNYKRHNELDNHDSEQCELCKKATLHLKKAEEARTEYRKDKEEEDPTASTFAADMQKVILLPKMTLKEHFFVSRLVVFNETFASVYGEVDLLILWHEAIAGRNANHVSSAFIKVIKSCNTEKVVFLVDNCPAQNKNWTLYTAMAWSVNQEWGPQVIKFKYLEPGHTFMRADSVHGAIGTKMKEAETIDTYDDFIDLCGKAGKRNRPIPMAANDFFQVKDGHPQRRTGDIPLLSEVCEVKFTKGCHTLEYKSRFDQESYTECKFLRRRFKLDTTATRIEGARGMQKKKKAGIVKLISSLPPEKQKFWLELPENGTVGDLVHQHE